ncbi:MAG: SUMF1/EgtB/PvdO family nonheme iron enzyme [Ignavibacteriales bacterium]|nr:SUMF1/EgtB/PvdO family nonheme iron enzyme [Ignavibacteriales bacterium]
MSIFLYEAISPPGLGGSLLKAPRLDTIAFLADTAVRFHLVDVNDTLRFPNAQFFYSIEQAQSGGLFSEIVRIGPNVRSVVVASSLSGDQTLLFRTRTMMTGDTSTYSDPAVRTLYFTPRQLSISSISDSAVTLAWLDSCNYETGIVVEQSTDGIAYYAVHVLGPNARGDTLHGFYSSSLTYYFRVRATSARSISGYSNIASGMIEFPAPGVLRLSSLSTAQLRLEWQDNSKIETGFDVQMSTDGSSFSTLALAGKDSTGASIPGTFVEGKTYSFRVRALRVKNGQTNYSAFSNVALGGVKDAAGIDWVSVDGGSFVMGSNAGQSNEQPETPVRLDSYKISRTEITFDQYHDFCLDSTAYADPSDLGWGRGNRPVINVSWDEANAFCRWASSRTGKTVRLCSEAEWEFACRGGTASKNYTYSGSNSAGTVAWTYENSVSRTQSVGSKQVNELGIYDMSGNVWEWCSDWYAAFPGTAQVNPNGPASGISRVLRGGSWYTSFRNATVHSRSDAPSSSRSQDVGFRVVKLD